LKKELVDYCKRKGLNYSGGKFDILERIAETLDKGLLSPNKKNPSSNPVSKFNWAKYLLSLYTAITDSYTNGPNTRHFFRILRP
jgi:SAP domain-containing new25